MATFSKYWVYQEKWTTGPIFHDIPDKCGETSDAAWQNPDWNIKRVVWCGKMWQNGGKTHLEVENNRPNQPKNKFWIPIDNIFSSDVNKPYLEYF